MQVFFFCRESGHVCILHLDTPRREARDVYCHSPTPPSVTSRLSFDSTLLSPLLFFCLVLLLFLAYLFFCLLVHSPELLPENSCNIFVKRCIFLGYGSCLAAGRSKLVGGMCSMLPYGTGICCYAFI